MGIVIYKGIIIDEKKKYYVLLTDDYQYIKIKKTNKAVVGERIYAIEEDICPAVNYNYKIIGTVAASFLVILIMFPLFYVNKNNSAVEVASVISMDINPSLEIEINDEDEIINILTYNEDAKILINNIDYKGKDIFETIKRLIDKSVELNYLNSNNNKILFAKTRTNMEDVIFQEKLESELTSYVQSYKICYIDAKETDLENSRLNNISLGKYETGNKSKKELNNLYILGDKKADQIETPTIDKVDKEQELEKVEIKPTDNNEVINKDNDKINESQNNIDEIKIDDNNNKINTVNEPDINETTNIKSDNNADCNKHIIKHHDRRQKQRDKIRSKELGIPYGQYKKITPFRRKK